MNAKASSSSFQDIVRRRQRKDFVGRDVYLESFRRNLSLSVEDVERQFIISVSGQAGVGKTWLMRCFRQLAEASQVMVASCDTAEEDVPAIMGRIAEELKGQGLAMTEFLKRYETYQQERLHLEADPEVPRGVLQGLASRLKKGGVRAARRLPAVGLIMEFVEEDELNKVKSKAVARIGSKDLQLVLDPIDTLTPIFVEGIGNLGESRQVCLFFDTYERTGSLLDEWLRDVLDGRYGELPAGFILVVAGRSGLDMDKWEPYHSIVATVSLEAFTEEEAQEYMVRKGVTDEGVIKVILALSGKLPLLVATLVAESPDKPEEVGDPTDTAIERFLLWVEDEERRDLAVDGSLPRQLNQDVVRMLVGDGSTAALFDWLKGMPFVEQRSGRWVYHPLVRSLILRYKQRRSEQGWMELQSRLAEYYASVREGLGLQEKVGVLNERWRRYGLEELYHRLCASPYREVASGLVDFLSMLGTELDLGLQVAEVMREAGDDSDCPTVADWGNRLIRVLSLKRVDKTMA